MLELFVHPLYNHAMSNTSQLRSVVTETIVQILAEKGVVVESIAESDTLQGSLGLDSLDLAVLVVRLEQQLGQDPFRGRSQVVATVGQLVAAYDQPLGDS